LSDLAKRRLRRHLKNLERDEAIRLLKLLERHSDPAAFLDLIAHPMFIEDYKNWGLKRKLIQDLADGRRGSRAASAKARSVLKAEGDPPPRIEVPWDTAGYMRVTREELYELVWSMPMVSASKRHGLSDNGLRRICRKLDVPTPPRGYWAKGRGQRRPTRLRAAKEGWPTEAWLPRPPAR